MKTVCCSSQCERKFECAKFASNNEGTNVCEDFYNFGCGTFTDNGCEIEHWCSELGNWKMFEQVVHKWNDLTEVSPPVNKEVELKIVINGEERIYTDRLIPMIDCTYIWQYGDYSGCDGEAAWRHLPLTT